jgi:hypothetical protein
LIIVYQIVFQVSIAEIMAGMMFDISGEISQIGAFGHLPGDKVLTY